MTTKKFETKTQEKWKELFTKYPDKPIHRLTEYMNWLQEGTTISYITIESVRKLLSNNCPVS